VFGPISITLVGLVASVLNIFLSGKLKVEVIGVTTSAFCFWSVELNKKLLHITYENIPDIKTVIAMIAMSFCFISLRLSAFVATSAK